MKKSIKLICLLTAFIIAFSSCSSAKKASGQLTELLAQNKFSEMSALLGSLDTETKNALNDEIAAAISEKYSEMISREGIDNNQNFNLTAYSREFTEDCRGLWSAAKQISVASESEYYDSFINLHYYAVMSDFMRYRELYALFTAINNNGYLNMLDKAVYSYTQNGDKSDFEKCYAAAQKFDYSPFDPQQHLISDFRTAHDGIIKTLRSLINSFNMNNLQGANAFLNTLKEYMASMLKLTDTLKAVNTKQANIFNTLSDNGLYRDFDTEIKIIPREYSPGIGFSLDFLSNGTSDFIDNEDIPNVGNVSSVSKEDAVIIAVGAINKTKSLTGNLKITVKNQKSLKLTSFDSESDNVTAAEIAKLQFETFINSSSGSSENTYSFTNGMSGDDRVFDTIPPYARECSLDPSLVNGYTAVRGDSGYVITLSLKPDYGTMKLPAENISTLVNSFAPDVTDEIQDYRITYFPSSVMVIVNNNGSLSKLQYSLTGICEYDLTNKSNNYSAKVSFNEKCLYDFEY